MNGFDCFIGVDWSGDGRRWQKGLKVAVAMPGRSAPQLVPGPGGNQRWSRECLADWIDKKTNDCIALIGMDFAFGFPVAQSSLDGVMLDWEYVDSLCSADANFYGGRFFSDRETAHAHLLNTRGWQGKDYKPSLLRKTDVAARCITTPQTIFNAVGPAQVGPSSISGMRFLLHLRRSMTAVAIWPFDRVAPAKSTIVEIFPRYFALSRTPSARLADPDVLNRALAAFESAPVSVAPKSEDEGDALLAAAALRCLAKDPSYFAVPPELPKAEGWIFGVPTIAA